MENKMSAPVEDEQEPQSVATIVSDVLGEKVKKHKFLCSVGIQKAPGRSNGPSPQVLEAELEMEKQGSNELRELVANQREQMDMMAKHIKDVEEARAKKDAETDALIRRLMTMIPQSHGIV
jgi:hypothetical protein